MRVYGQGAAGPLVLERVGLTIGGQRSCFRRIAQFSGEDKAVQGGPVVTPGQGWMSGVLRIFCNFPLCSPPLRCWDDLPTDAKNLTAALDLHTVLCQRSQTKASAKLRTDFKKSRAHFTSWRQGNFWVAIFNSYRKSTRR